MKPSEKHASPELSRRTFLFSTAAWAITRAASPRSPAQTQTPASFSTLKPLGDRVHPITPDEFHGRLLRAQELMGQLNPKFDALFIGPGTSLYYFTGIRWHLSERLLALIVPRAGQPLLVSPAFEESRMRESLRYPAEVRVWQEDESPTKIIAGALSDRGMRSGRVGIEEMLPFTFYDHFRAAGPAYEGVSADPVTIACRAQKSAHELELMRLACTATCDVFREVFANLKEGMSEKTIGDLVMAGFAKMNLHGEALVLLGAAAALPHGSKQPQKLKEGEVVLIDGGCSVDGYQSDITRTAVFGKPSAKIHSVFEIVRKAQDTDARRRPSGETNGLRRQRRPRGGHQCGLRSGIQIFYASSRPWHRPRWSRASLSGTRQHDSPRARHDFFKRAGHLHPRRIRPALRRRYGHFRRRPGAAVES